MNKKIMATFAVLMIALSVFGFAYAAWTDMVYIEGTVKMGELIVGWYDTDPYLLTWVETINDVPEEEFVPYKDVCDAVITLSGERTSVHHDPVETVYEKMTITVDNAFPQWDCEITAWLKNAGTIPAKVNPDFSLYFYDEKDDQELGFRVDTSGYDAARECSYVTGAVTDPVAGDIINFVLELFVPVDWQLEPCTAHKLYLEIDFKQEAEECHTYTFDVVIDAIQWNKATW